MLNFIHSSKPARMSKVVGTDFIAIASHNGYLKTQSCKEAKLTLKGKRTNPCGFVRNYLHISSGS